MPKCKTHRQKDTNLGIPIQYYYFDNLQHCFFDTTQSYNYIVIYLLTILIVFIKYFFKKLRFL